MKKNLFFALAFGLFATACNDSVESVTVGETESCNVNLKLSMQDWDSSGKTRAATNLAYPITVFYVANGQTNVNKVKTITSGETNFSFSVPNGEYDIYAVCGLAEKIIPENIGDLVEIPKNDDFSVATASFSVNNGSCDPIELKAQHEMAWLEMTISDVPSSISTVNLYVKGLYTEYSFSEGWQEPSLAMKEKYTKIAVSKDGSDYKTNTIILPGSDKTAVDFIVEVTTASGYTKLLKGSAPTPLSAGTHMIVTANLLSLNVIEENVTMSEWSETTASGTITDFTELNIGDQYFGQAATVVKITETMLLVMPHKPMTVNLSDVKSWSDFKNISYNESPEININRWSVANVQAANEIANNIRNLGWEKFAATIEASGNSIDQNAENLVIAYDQTSKKFWRLDCNTLSVEIVNDESGEFLLYPIGVINLL